MQCVAVCSNVLRHVAARCSVLQRAGVRRMLLMGMRCSVLQCVAVYCSVLQCVAVCCIALTTIMCICICIYVYINLCTCIQISSHRYIYMYVNIFFDMSYKIALQSITVSCSACIGTLAWTRLPSLRRIASLWNWRSSCPRFWPWPNLPQPWQAVPHHLCNT